LSTALKPIFTAKQEFGMYFTVTYIEKAPIHSYVVLRVLFVEVVNHSYFLHLLLLPGIQAFAQNSSHIFKLSRLTRKFL